MDTTQRANQQYKFWCESAAIDPATKVEQVKIFKKELSLKVVQYDIAF